MDSTVRFPRRRRGDTPFGALAFLLLVLAACGQGPTDSSYDLVGRWRAEFSQQGNIPEGAQFSATLINYDVTLIFRPDNGFRLEFVYTALGMTRKGAPEEGIYFVRGDGLMITGFSAEPSDLILSGRMGTFRIDGDELVLEGIFRGPVPPFTLEAD